VHIDSHDSEAGHVDHDHNTECGHCHQDHTHAHGHHHHDGVPEPHKGKQGILLSAFGCALPHTHKHYDLFEEEVRKNHPNMDVRWAFTANRIRTKLLGRGIKRLSVAEALSQMIDDGISHVAVQSLHTLPGVEYDWTVQQAKAMCHPRKGLTQIAIGAPLLQSMSDLKRAAKAVLQCLLPKCGREDGVILVGHGTYHQSHTLYLALESLLLRTNPNVAMATLMDSNQPTNLGRKFLDRGMKRVFLVPFMCVPGHHVHVDLFGDHDHTWLKTLTAMGIEVIPIHTGSLEHHDFRDIWHDHLSEAITDLAASQVPQQTDLP